VAFAVGVAATVIGMGLSAWIQGRAFRMNAVTVFIALLFFGWLWGGWGLLVGVPLLAIAKTTIDRIPSLERFITLISDEPRPAPIAIEKQ
jgi:predicted PurR-regulated permease PerM